MIPCLFLFPFRENLVDEIQIRLSEIASPSGERHRDGGLSISIQIYDIVFDQHRRIFCEHPAVCERCLYPRRHRRQTGERVRVPNRAFPRRPRPKNAIDGSRGGRENVLEEVELEEENEREEANAREREIRAPIWRGEHKRMQCECERKYVIVDCLKARARASGRGRGAF